jgi:hypothetical protein
MISSIASAPILFRVKAWQLIGLGFTGWVTIYSIALINWATCGRVIANAQGGCFAATMALAGIEARRLKRNRLADGHDVLHWADNIPVFQLNHTLDQIQKKNGFISELLGCQETEMGFGVRTVKEGRTIVFETSRWKEPVIDLQHAKSTDENRRMARADMAVIVSIGVPAEDTKQFVKSVPVKLLIGDDLQVLIESELPKSEIMVTANNTNQD